MMYEAKCCATKGQHV
jgi:hypothetical protein